MLVNNYLVRTDPTEKPCPQEKELLYAGNYKVTEYDFSLPLMR